jgi:hypothetical protein
MTILCYCIISGTKFLNYERLTLNYRINALFQIPFEELVYGYIDAFVIVAKCYEEGI